MNNRIRFLLVGLYAWVAAVLFGGILLDMTYAKLLKDAIGLSERTMIFSDISDTLLLFSFVMLITALGAVLSSWKYRTARYIFVASILAFFFEFLIPLGIPFIKDAQGLSWIRLLPSGMASILAFIGLYKFYRQ